MKKLCYYLTNRKLSEPLPEQGCQIIYTDIFSILFTDSKLKIILKQKYNARKKSNKTKTNIKIKFCEIYVTLLSS